MAMERECPVCRRRFAPRRSDQVFCCGNCRKRNWKRRHARDSLVPLAAPPEGWRDHPVTTDELAEAVVAARSLVSAFSAGAITGPPELRPLCSRLSEGIAEILAEEGL